MVNQSTGLSVRGNVRPRPLQASTNIIHTKIGANLKENSTSSLIFNKQNLPNTNLKKNDANTKKDNASIKAKQSDLKKSTKSIITNKNKPQAQTDENDVQQYVKESYNPLDHVHPFDEELYQKVAKLELADDGLPKFESEEPFDF